MEISSIKSYEDFATSIAQPQGISRQQQAETRQLIQAIRKVNEAELFGYRSELTFALDRATGRPLVRIIDRQTKELIQQIPSEYVLRMAEDLKSR